MRGELHLPFVPPRARGVTLIELVIVIALISIISAVAAIAMRDPIQAYSDTARRAELTDIADGALRRIGRDIRGALPNSVRVQTPGNTYLEFFPIRTGGRYRADGTAPSDPLNFSGADTTFSILGAPSAEPGQAIAVGDILVIRNESADPADVRSNAYTYNQSGTGFNCTAASGVNCNTATIAAPVPPPLTAVADEYKLTFSSRLFNFDTAAGRGFGSPGNRFYVVTPPVTYVCPPSAPVDANGDGTGTLSRVTGYGITLAQPTPAGGDLLAKNVTACEISYNPNALGYTGLVALRLALTRGNETVSLYHEVHINNAP